MSAGRKALIWLDGAIKTPPFSAVARAEAGALLRRVQEGESFGMPHSRPMPGIGARCHDMRVRDQGHNWRIVYRVDRDALLIVAVFAKTTQQTPSPIIEACARRLAVYDRAIRGH